MKIISPLPRKRGRLEIIPLIDIMFFLLAAFMMVSINKIKVDSLKIALPTDVPSTIHETKEDFVSISLDADGNVQMDKARITDKNQFLDALRALYAKNVDQKILISADRESRHGDVMTVLGKIRQAGFQKVAFSIKNEPLSAGAGGPGAAAPTSAPLTPGAPGAPAAPAGAPAAPAAPSAPTTMSTPPAAPAAPAASTPAAPPTAPASPAAASPTPAGQ